MRLTRRGATVGAALFALTAMVTLAACSDDNNGPTRVYLTGDYDVIGLWQGLPSETPDPQPVGGGTAVLTTTNYTITIPAIETVTTGTYEAFSDGTFTQDGTVTIAANPPQDIQCTGTFVEDAGEVTVDTICLGQRTVTVLLRD